MKKPYLMQKRYFKQKQLYIWGEKDLRKSSLIRELSYYMKIYPIPNEDFYDLYQSNFYDLTVYDEFGKDNSKCIAFLNQFVEGNVFTLRKKGSQYIKSDNPPCIIIGNDPLIDIYDNESYRKLEAFTSRFISVEVKDVLNCFKEYHYPIINPIYDINETQDTQETQPMDI